MGILLALDSPYKDSRPEEKFLALGKEFSFIQILIYADFAPQL